MVGSKRAIDIWTTFRPKSKGRLVDQDFRQLLQPLNEVYRSNPFRLKIPCPNSIDLAATMPLRYLQLRGQDPNYDLVSLRGLYSPENSLVGKALVEELDVDDWDNWMRWDLGTTGLLTPEEEAKDNTAGNPPSPGAYFSDLEFPVNDEAPSSAVTERGMTIEDVLIDIDEDTESLLFSPTSSTGSMFLRDLHQPVDPTSLLPVANGKFLAVEDPEVVSRQPTSASGTKAARSKLSRPLQVDTPSRGTRKRRASKDDTELNSPCLSKKRGHNAIEKRYRCASYNRP